MNLSGTQRMRFATRVIGFIRLFAMIGFANGINATIGTAQVKESNGENLRIAIQERQTYDEAKKMLVLGLGLPDATGNTRSATELTEGEISKQLDSHPEVESLHIILGDDVNEITGEFLIGRAPMTTVRELEISVSPFEDNADLVLDSKAVDSLPNVFPNLHYLILNGVRVSCPRSVIEVVSKFESLKILSLNNCSVDDVCVRELIPLIGDSTSLTYLDLRNSRISNKAAKELITVCEVPYLSIGGPLTNSIEILAAVSENSAITGFSLDHDFLSASHGPTIAKLTDQQLTQIATILCPNKVFKCHESLLPDIPGIRFNAIFFH